MAAPKGNQFWKLRSKHGRDKLFESPELLWDAACEYFQWCEDNPWQKTETTIRGVNKDVKTIPTERPFTMQGLCLYLDCNTKYFNNFKIQLSENDKDFSYIITRIEETVYKQKFEGAAVGAFNANIIARDLGLTDNKDITSKGNELKKLTDSDRNKILDDLENDR